ncbi:MAG: hypothetical protein KF764_08605 [Labilithrix sp.]|nr:hypothetical protein [Labilithrix sp.]
MSLVVNGLEVASMRWLAPWSGVWVAELDLPGEVPPVGRVAITSTDGIVLSGTVDSERSGMFGPRRHARVVGGGAGWSRTVRPQHYHSPVGVALAIVASTTAAEAGEVVIVLAPSVLGTDFVRRAGPASQIFLDAGLDWWVGLDGITRVGIRPPIPMMPTLEILDWDPATGTMGFTSPVLVEPGTMLVDDRFGARIVRQVEALVAGGSVSGTLWTADAPPALGSVDELTDTLGALAVAATRVQFARFHTYVVIAMEGPRVALQALSPLADIPPILPGSIWAGVSGYRAILRPGTQVLVGFRDGDQAKPFVAFYEAPEGEGWRPVGLELDAIASIAIGEQALSVVLGSGAAARPVVRMTEAFAAWITAVTAAVNSVAPGSATPPADIASPKVRSS